MTDEQTSKNERAEKLVGLRHAPPNVIVLDWPCELGYHCPVCKYENIVDGNFDERLHWSEYNGFCWCEVCNKDYPSALCQPDIDKAIKTYLDCIEDAAPSAERQRVGEALIEWAAEESNVVIDTSSNSWVNYYQCQLCKSSSESFEVPHSADCLHLQAKALKAVKP